MKSIVFASAALYCACLWAGPAAWYKWHSPESDIDVCSQTTPGDGWIIVKGPFQDGVCKKLGVPR